MDILEIGVPFSDPLADGLTNQLAAQRALEAGMTHGRLLALVSRVRAAFPGAPIVLYTYYNLIFAHGLASCLRQYKEAGVDGLLTLDCPPEEAGELLAASRDADLANIFLVAPTTPPGRIKDIVRAASGFIYYVSHEGVTGERSVVGSDLTGAVSRIRQHTSLPVVVGFGISARSHVEAVGRVDFAGGNARQMRESCARLAKLLPATRVLPGHDQPTTIAHEQTHGYLR